MKYTKLFEGEFAQNRLKGKQEITRGLLKQKCQLEKELYRKPKKF